MNPGIKSSGITEFQAVARTEQRRDSRARGRESEEACRGCKVITMIFHTLSSHIHPVYTTLLHTLAQSSPATRRLGSLGRMDLRSCGPFSRCGFSPSSASDAGLATLEGPGVTFPLPCALSRSQTATRGNCCRRNSKSSQVARDLDRLNH